MTQARIICLGNLHASDDGAALRATEHLDRHAECAGRPGVSLLELLRGNAPVVLVDVTQSGAPPGTVRRIPLSVLAGATQAEAALSSHGFGPGETLRLSEALGRPLPPGEFVGLEGECFDPGSTLSGAVERAMPAFVRAINDALRALEEVNRSFGRGLGVAGKARKRRNTLGISSLRNAASGGQDRSNDLFISWRALREWD